MPSADHAEVLRQLAEHRSETREDMKELRHATTKMADALSEMSQTMVRSEERHSAHEHTMTRIGGVLDDHEGRLKMIERTQATNMVTMRVGWKALTIATSGTVAVITLGIAAISALK